MGSQQALEARVKSDLRTRLTVAGIGVPLCALVVFVGGPIFALGLGTIAAVGYWEYATMLRATGTRVFVALGCAATFFFPLVVLYGGFSGGGLYGGALLLVFSAFGVARVDLSDRPMLAAAATSFGALYIGGLLSFAVPIREGWMLVPPVVPEPGNQLGHTLFFFFPVAITWLADTAAFFGGSSFGRRPLAPQVSPNKTIEGAVCALVIAPFVALLYTRWVLPGGWELGWIETVIFGLVVAAVAIVGDLIESALKRECKVKDSSNLLPGHGGLLDRLDSLLWALPAAFFMMVLFK
jgi:phosphatidate cytidylyltransferase